MPIYEYRCAKCGDFDVSQKITEAPLKKCPTCKAKVSKLISSPAFHLKGSGWYVTDYAGKGKKDAAKAESSSSPSSSSDSSPSSSSSDSSSKGDAKPAAKASA
ncbi:zinc ribbon domain-containing protein [bacterium]|nr:zinc ribbon domain-containing protein [bacterium]